MSSVFKKVTKVKIYSFLKFWNPHSIKYCGSTNDYYCNNFNFYINSGKILETIQCRTNEIIQNYTFSL